MNTKTVLRIAFIMLILASMFLSACNLDYNKPYIDGSARQTAYIVHEDGSFQFDLFTGCLPLALCNR